MFMLWTLLFGRFDRQDKVSQTRALFWESIHFPLHFSILLLLAGIVNTITSISTYSGVEKAADSVCREGVGGVADLTTDESRGRDVQQWHETLPGRARADIKLF